MEAGVGPAFVGLYELLRMGGASKAQATAKWEELLQKFQ